MNSRELFRYLALQQDPTIIETPQLALENIALLVNFIFGGSTTTESVQNIDELRSRLNEFKLFCGLKEWYQKVHLATPLLPLISQFGTAKAFNASLVTLSPQSVRSFWHDYFAIELVLSNELWSTDVVEVGYQIDPVFHSGTRNLVSRKLSNSVHDASRAKLYSARFGSDHVAAMGSRVLNARLNVQRVRSSPGRSSYSVVITHQPTVNPDDDVELGRGHVDVADDRPKILNVVYAANNRFSRAELQQLSVPSWSEAISSGVDVNVEMGLVEFYVNVAGLYADPTSTMPKLAHRVLCYESFTPQSRITMGIPAITDVTSAILGFKLYFAHSPLAYATRSDETFTLNDDSDFMLPTARSVHHQEYLRLSLYRSLLSLLRYELAGLWSNDNEVTADTAKDTQGGFLMSIVDGMTSNFISIAELLKRAIVLKPLNKIIPVDHSIHSATISTPMAASFTHSHKRDGNSMRDISDFNYALVEYTNLKAVSNVSYFRPDELLTPPGGVNEYRINIRSAINPNSMAEYIQVYDDADIRILLFQIRQATQDPKPGKVTPLQGMSVVSIDAPSLLDLAHRGGQKLPSERVVINGTANRAGVLVSKIGDTAPEFEVKGVRCVIVCKRAVFTPNVDSSKPNTVTVEFASAGVKQVALTFDSWQGVELTMPNGELFHAIAAAAEIPPASKYSLKGVILTHRLPSFEETKGAIVRAYSNEFDFNLRDQVVRTNYSGVATCTDRNQVQLNMRGSALHKTVELYYELSGVVKYGSDLLSSVQNVPNPGLGNAFTKHLSDLPHEPSTPITTLSRMIARMTVCHLSLLVPRSEDFPLTTFAAIAELDDIAFQLAVTTDTAVAAMSLAEANKKRLDVIETAQEVSAKWAMVTFAIDLLSVVVPGGQVVGVFGKIMTQSIAKASRVGNRALNLSMYTSEIASTFRALVNAKGLRDLPQRMSNVLAESAIIWRLSRRYKYEKLSEDSTDLFRKSLNFTLVDPTEYLKFNILTNYAKKPTGVPDADVLNLTKDFGHLDDLTSSSLSVMHRPLSILPPGLRGLAFHMATDRVTAASQRKLTKWLSDTRHPTHSYVVLTEDLPSRDKSSLIHRVTMVGVGDPNPGGKPTGDKGAGIGSYCVEFDVLGVDRITGKRVMRPRAWDECGYSASAVDNIFKTMFKPSATGLSSLSHQDKWDRIVTNTRDRVINDLRISSIPLSFIRADQIRKIADGYDWKYNLLNHNCQNFAHGMYEYARGGLKPSWLRSSDLSSIYHDEVNTLDDLLTWSSDVRHARITRSTSREMLFEFPSPSPCGISVRYSTSWPGGLKHSEGDGN